MCGDMVCRGSSSWLNIYLREGQDGVSQVRQGQLEYRLTVDTVRDGLSKMEWLSSRQ